MKSEISTSIFCFSISSEILSTYLYFLKLISSSYSLPSIVVFTHGRNWEVRLGRSFLRHHTHSKPPAFSNPERNPPIPAKISKYFISTNHLLSDFSNKKQSSFFQNLTVTLIYSFLHILFAHYLHLRYESRPHQG